MKREEGKVIECKIKGNLGVKGIGRRKGIGVGEGVEMNVNGEGRGLISEIEEGKN